MRKSEKVAKELQRRRMRVDRPLLKGVAQAEVARRVGVSRTTVSTLSRDLKRAGLDRPFHDEVDRPAEEGPEVLQQPEVVIRVGARWQRLEFNQQIHIAAVWLELLRIDRGAEHLESSDPKAPAQCGDLRLQGL